MSDSKRSKPVDLPKDMSAHLDSIDKEEIHSKDFQFVLKELLNGYQEIMKEDLGLAKEPERLKKEAEENPPNCEQELKFAESDSIKA